MKRLVVNFIRYYKIWLLQLYSNLMRRMAYPFNFYLMAGGVLLQMFLSIAFIKIVFNFIDKLAGWSYFQALLVVASYMIIEGLMWGSCAYLNGIQKNIQDGTLDGLIVKPIDTQYLVTIWRSDPEDWMRVITAFVVFFIAIKGLGLTGGSFILNLVYYIYLIFNAYLIIYSMTLFVRTLSFWTTEVEGLWRIIESITRLSQYPTDIFFQKTVSFIFTAIIPLTFMATVPAKILINGPNLILILSSTLIAAIFFAASRKFFNYALKHYSSASS